MSWKKEVGEIEERRERALELGGAEAVARHHERGRLTCRERVEALVDKGSFREYGQIAGSAETDADGALTSYAPASVVVGIAQLDGRACVVGADDFTVRGAAYSPAGLKKGQYADELAVQRRVPLIRLLEGGGASVAGATGTRGRSGYDLTSSSPLNELSVKALATVPVACAAVGAVAGFPAARLAASHFSLMTRDTAQVLTGGPALVERATGEAHSKEALGGADVHLRSGVVDNAADDEADVWRQIRRFLSYLPSNAWEAPPLAEAADPPSRRDEALLDIVPRNRRRPYKMRALIGSVVDRDSFFELRPLYGRTQIIGLARLRGQPVGVVANDCMQYGGCMSAEGAQKIRRFVETCDLFHLPIVSLVDEPGFMIGADAERAGTIRYGMEAMFAVQQTSVPWVAVVVRRAFGVATGIHIGPGCTVLAWPSAESGALPVEAGVALAFRREIESAPDPEARRRELEQELEAAQSVFPRAEDFGVHELLDPRETRPRLCHWIEEIRHQLADHVRSGPPSYTMRP